MNTHPLKREDYKSTSEFAAAVRQYHEQHGNAAWQIQQQQLACRRAKIDDDDGHAEELRRERQAESMTVYGSIDLIG